MLNNEVAYTPLEEAVSKLRPIDERIYTLAHMMEV
jgi:hypothetical protein